MPPVTNGGLFRVVLKGHMHGQLIENVFYFRGRPDFVDSDGMLSDLRTNLWHQIRTDISNNYVLDSILLQEIYPVHRDPMESVENDPGSAMLDALPAQVAVVISLKTGLGGRQNRGRKYLAGLPHSQVVNSVIVPETLAALSGHWGLVQSWFRGSTSLASLEWGLVHRRLGGAPVPLTAGSFVPLISVTVQRITGTMRTRIPGHGA